MINIPYWADLFAVMMFAISGALAASDRNIHRDFFGVTFIAFITAIGGGSLRDIMLGVHPLAWISDANYLVAIGIGVTLAVIFEKGLGGLRRTLFLFDTVGIGLYTIIGLQKSLALGVNPIAACIMGMFSAIFGGVIRDVLLNEIPLIFRKEIYATACLAGAAVYLLLVYAGLHLQAAGLISMGVIIVIRVLAVKYKWSLPKIGRTDDRLK